MTTKKRKTPEEILASIDLSRERGPTLEGILAKLDQGFPDEHPVHEQIAKVKARYRALVNNEKQSE